MLAPEPTVFVNEMSVRAERLMPPPPLLITLMVPPLPVVPAFTDSVPLTPLVAEPAPMAKITGLLVLKFMVPPLPVPTPEAINDPFTNRLPPVLAPV